jgi:hypothetical protein
VEGGIDVVIGRRLPDAGNLEYQQTTETDCGDYVQSTGLLRNKPCGEELPVLFLGPRQRTRVAVIWLHQRGKSGLLDDDARPKPEVRRLIASGATVAGVDLLGQGEFLADGKPIERTRRVENPREAAAYTFGYNHSLFAQRVHDVLSLVSFLRNRSQSPARVCLAGLEGAGPWAAAARAQAPSAIDLAAIDTGAFRFGKLLEIHHPDFLPGGTKYGDLPGMLAVAAPAELWLAGEGAAAPPLVSAAYRSAGAMDRLAVFDGKPDEKASAAAGWLAARAENITSRRWQEPFRSRNR